ncbi:MAG: UbiX family flavin prenyltransferase, partial [Clostridia bacterium]|nr:UbiX family flavin prenyltransferase [Clostridia bacterium]
WALETDEDISALYELADVNYEPYDMAASISSGSFVTEGMIVLPCSMKTLAGIVSGYTDNLLLRAADVCMKEGRKLVVCPRETPFGKVHLRNLYEASQLGCTVVPPMLTFYSGAKTLDEQIDHVIGKILLQFGIVPKSFKQWK